ncbi:DegT/DnrJ/EryC1/StrS family aminotransferase [Methanocaldococcus sp.]
MKIPFVDLSRQLKDIFPEIEEKWHEIVHNSRFVGSKYVKEFEDKFANYLDVKHCIAVNSGTSALYLSLMALGVGRGDEVILPVNTFIATAEAVSLLGAKPVFVDIDKKTYNIDVKKIEKAITDKTKVIIPVHLYGQCSNMDEILEIAEKYNLYIVEDACQAHGAEYKGKKAGSLGDLAAFSFYPGKNLGAFGEGGAVVTNCDELAEKIRMLRNHGSKVKYYHEMIGGNFRMDEIQGAVLSTKLKFLDTWNNMRRKAAKIYNELLEDVVITPYEVPYNKHVYHLYVIRVDNRDKIKEYLQKHGIETGIHYPIPLHLQSAYKFLNIPKGSFPVAEKVADEILSLPMFPYIIEEEILYVAERLKEGVKNG